MQETEFRQLFLTTYGASLDFTIWAPNPGGVTIRNRRGAVTGRFNSGIATGTLDLMGFTHGDGLHFEFELKNEETVTSHEQTVRMGRLRSVGCVVAFYRINREWSIGENLRRAHLALTDAIQERRSHGKTEWRSAMRGPACFCPAATEYDPPCPRHGVLGIGVTGRD